jgi:hypothetical protein
VRAAEALRTRHFAPQFIGASALLRLHAVRPRARNAAVNYARVCLSASSANAPPAHRRERLRNWLALLALLAIGIVWS